MNNIKWGIIGLGNIAKKFAHALKGMEGVTLEAVASRTEESSEAFGKEYDLQLDKCYGSYKEIVKDEAIDVIYIAVPHSFHKEISILCLENGKSVLCEKPVAIDKEEIEEVIKIAKEKNLFFMEAMKTRFLPINLKVKQWIEEGRIGEVQLLQADFGFKVDFNPSHRLYNKELGGGALLDVGIYGVSYSSFIFGNEPISIKGNAYIGTTGVDENISISLRYKEGKLAQLYSSINLETRREANIIGTEGRICVPRFSNAEYAKIISNGKEENIHIPFKINGFEYQIQQVTKCIKEGKTQSDLMSWKDSVEIMKIMDYIKNNWN
ncbi:MAG: Gfo/Idh/MocA family protein [Clostridiaceae bacterium]